jgi:UDP-N-acetylglucosamine 2-epimerase (non-hydrolysing)
MSKGLFCFGTRPELIKIAPVLKLMGDNASIFFTGQHSDLIDVTNVQVPIDYTCGEFEEYSDRMGTVISKILKWFPDGSWKYVVVQGDTASAYACALAAFHRKIPIVHIEAGLRSYDIHNPFPEEVYRTHITSMASVNFCPTDVSMDIVSKETSSRLDDVVTIKSGNTIIDSLQGNSDITEGEEILITLHRRENLNLIPFWVFYIHQVAQQFTEQTFTFVLHPNTKRELSLYYPDYVNELPNINFVDSMSHEEFQRKLRRCKFVITDSGGIEEESDYYGKYRIICRSVTERIEGIGHGSYICLLPHWIPQYIQEVMHKISSNERIPPFESVYGNGTASETISSHLLSANFNLERV